MADWDVDAAVAHLDRNARSYSTGNCAKYVREAIAAGGIRLIHKGKAKDYGSSLVAAGFHESSISIPQTGDVAIIQPIPNHPDGHMAMFDGRSWVSDFKQNYGYYPGQEYRSVRPVVKFYRR